MTNNKPHITIICPCYNECTHISACLDSILQQDCTQPYEILVIDGLSTDGTRDIIASYQHQYPSIHLIDNPQRISPVAMNIGIQHAQGEYIVRADAHSIYPTSYVSTLLHYLTSLPNAQNVGPLCNTISANNSHIAKAIAIASSHRFGVGNSLFRIGVSSVQEADTVPFGCWRKAWLMQIGGFDEELVRNQDDELNARTIQHGGKIYLIPELVVDYYARPTLRKTWQMFFQYGLYKPIVNKKLHQPATLRQFVPPLFVLGCIPALPLYFTLVTILAISNHNAGLILAFPTIHFSYGIGYWMGLYKVFAHKPVVIQCNH